MKRVAALCILRDMTYAWIKLEKIEYLKVGQWIVASIRKVQPDDNWKVYISLPEVCRIDKRRIFTTELEAKASVEALVKKWIDGLLSAK